MAEMLRERNEIVTQQHHQQQPPNLEGRQEWSAIDLALMYPCKPTQGRRISTSLAGKTTEPTQVEKLFALSETVEGREILSWRDFSPEEIAASWISDAEIIETETDMLTQILRVEDGRKMSDEKYCSRGLEQYTRANAFTRRDNIQHGVRVVLLEQLKQQKTGEFDDNRIAEVLHRVSSSCHMWAAVVGLRDQRDAEKYMDEDSVEHIAALVSPHPRKRRPVEPPRLPYLYPSAA
jgi:hypothetical protein